MYNYLAEKIEGLDSQKQMILGILSAYRKHGYWNKRDRKRVKKLYRDLDWIEFRIGILNTIKFYF